MDRLWDRVGEKGREAWPASPPALLALQEDLAGQGPAPWQPPSRGPLGMAGCYVCFPRGEGGPGAAGDRAWAAAVVLQDQTLLAQHVVTGVAPAPYCPGLLALREGALLAEAVAAVAVAADVLLVDATGRDHPRRAGLALHLGAVLDLPSVGVTHRPLLARGTLPADEAGAVSPLVLEGEPVAAWLRVRPGVRPVVVHPAWRTDLATAIAVIESACPAARTPEPLRQARRLAREARAHVTS